MSIPKKILCPVLAVLACYLAFVVVAVIVDTKNSRESSSSQGETAAGDTGRVKAERHYPGKEEFKAGMALFEAGDKESAIDRFIAAAEQGNPVAKYKLGLCFLNAEGVDTDLTEARFWFRKAAEQGNARAQFLLGVCYDKGHGVEQDKAEAVKWYSQAAEQGYELAKEALKKLEN